MLFRSRPSAGQQDAIPGPIDITAAPHIPGTDSDIPPLMLTGIIKPLQIFWIMGKIRIHFEDERIVIADSPLETMDIRRAKPQFPLPLFQEKLPRILQLQLPDDTGRAIGRTVIDYQDMIPLSQLKNGFQDIGNILPFVIRRYDDDLFQMASICPGGSRTLFLKYTKLRLLPAPRIVLSTLFQHGPVKNLGQLLLRMQRKIPLHHPVIILRLSL